MCAGSGLGSRCGFNLGMAIEKGCIKAGSRLKARGEAKPDSNNNNLLKHLSASTLCGILLTGALPIQTGYPPQPACPGTKRKANKAKLAIDVRLTRRMSDANATFMACACLGVPSVCVSVCVGVNVCI